MKKVTSYINQLATRIIPNFPTQTRACHQVSLPEFGTTLPSPSPSFPTSIRPDSRSEGSLISYARRWIGKKNANRHQCPVDMLPDEVLLAILDLCVDENGRTKENIEAWQTLVHVSQRWRGVVFGSPRHLNLQLVCSGKTPARDTLDVWPALPLVVQCYKNNPIENVDNIVAVLERSNRVCQIHLLGVSSPDLETVSVAMKESFPELTLLRLSSDGETVPVIPDSFLGGSAPRLRNLYFDGIPFPGLPKLLLSATHLVDLSLYDIPHSGYFSPDAMVNALSTLTSLEEFRLQFQSPRSCPDRVSRRPPPSRRFVLPVLAYCWFKGVGEYLDDLVARIDAPRLYLFHIIFFNQIVFDSPQLIEFITRTRKLRPFEKALVIFEDGAVRVKLSSPASDYGELEVKIPCIELDWQVSSLEQLFTSCLPPLSKLEDLYIYGHPLWKILTQDNIENMLWLELLLPFTAVKNLYLSEEFARRIVPALQELIWDGTTEVVLTLQELLGVGMTEVLPALQSVFLEGLETSGPVQEGIRQFVASRQASHPIAVSRWYRI